MRAVDIRRDGGIRRRALASTHGRWVSESTTATMRKTGWDLGSFKTQDTQYLAAQSSGSVVVAPRWAKRHPQCAIATHVGEPQKVQTLQTRVHGLVGSTRFQSVLAAACSDLGTRHLTPIYVFFLLPSQHRSVDLLFFLLPSNYRILDPSLHPLRPRFLFCAQRSFGMPPR
jgi:hypothetical protein